MSWHRLPLSRELNDQWLIVPLRPCGTMSEPPHLYSILRDRLDLNQRLLPSQGSTLSTELRPQNHGVRTRPRNLFTADHISSRTLNCREVDPRGLEPPTYSMSTNCSPN